MTSPAYPLTRPDRHAPTRAGRQSKWSALRALSIAALLLSSPSAGTIAGEPDPATLTEFVSDPRAFYFGLRTSEAIQCGQAVLSVAGNYDRRTQIETLTCLGLIYHSTHRMPQARASFLGILELDPLAELRDAAQLPPAPVRFFYQLRDSLAIVSGNLGATDIQTLAIGDIENNSIMRGEFNLDNFARGLTHIITSDLLEVSPFKIVDRQRLTTLMHEIGMSQSRDIMDPEFSVPLGKLTGAQSFIFGSIMQVDGKKVRLDLRWVNTATSEILLSVGLTAKLSSSDDLFKLERKLLLDTLLPRIDEWLEAGGQKADTKGSGKSYLRTRRQSFEENRTAYRDFILKSGAAIIAEERGDLKVAQELWSAVQVMYPDDPLAGHRARALITQLAYAEQ